ncbi:MAG: hypothetical protein HY680_03635 [Chloroflexi bacterium]|nr:hypothetical protein [Chloroflexota bacterium]
MKHDHPAPTLSPVPWPRERDPQLYDHYARRLLVPGWAGELSPEEYGYLHASLLRFNRLRTAWGFPAGETRLMEAAIRPVAQQGSPDDAQENTNIVRQVKIWVGEARFPDTKEIASPQNRAGEPSSVPHGPGRRADGLVAAQWQGVVMMSLPPRSAEQWAVVAQAERQRETRPIARQSWKCGIRRSAR